MHLWGEGGGNLRDMDASELAYYAQAAGMCSAEEQDVVRDEFQVR